MVARLTVALALVLKMALTMAGYEYEGDVQLGGRGMILAACLYGVLALAEGRYPARYPSTNAPCHVCRRLVSRYLGSGPRSARGW